MKRPLASLVALILALSGCKGSGGSSAALDPFLGRPRIDPPRTGSISPQPPGNSYPPGSAQLGSAQPFAATPALSGPGPAPGAISSVPQASGTRATGVPAAIPARSPNSPPTSPTSPTSPSWTAPQARPAPAIGPAQPYGVQPYPASSGASGASLSPSPSTSPSTGSGEGDRITIPFAARTISDPPRQLTASGRPLNPLRPTAATDPAPRAVGGMPYTPPGWRNPAQPGPASGAMGSNQLAGRDRVIQVIEPGPRDYANPLRNAPRPVDPSPRPDAQPPASAQPLRSEPGRPVNISDLPEPK